MTAEELFASDHHDDCAMMMIRATMNSRADDAEHRSNSLTLSQWPMVMKIASWDDEGCARLQICGVGSACRIAVTTKTKDCPRENEGRKRSD